jgi:hypothetical protein
MMMMMRRRRRMMMMFAYITESIAKNVQDKGIIINVDAPNNN